MTLTVTTGAASDPALSIALFSLWVAVFAAVTGIIALIWQIATRGPGAYKVKISSVQVGRDDRTFTIWVRNVGTSDVEIESWSVYAYAGVRMLGFAYPGWPCQTMSLRAGTSAVLEIGPSDSEETISALEKVKGKNLYLQAELNLATGRDVEGGRIYIGQEL